MIYLKICFVGYDHKKAIPLIWVHEIIKDNLGEINDYITNIKSGYNAKGYVGVFKRFDNADQEDDTIVLNPIEQFLITDGLTQKQIKEYVGRVI